MEVWCPLPTAMERTLGLAPRPLAQPSDSSLCHPWLLQRVPMGPGTLPSKGGNGLWLEKPSPWGSRWHRECRVAWPTC